MGRITRVCHTYWERPGNPTPFPATKVRESRQTKNDEQPYHRETTVGNRWTAVNFGWIVDPSLVVVINLEKQPTKRDAPTPFLEIAFSKFPVPPDPELEPMCLLPPGEPFEFWPGEGWILCVRGRFADSPISFSVTVLPS